VCRSALEARVNSRQQVGTDWVRLGVSVLNVFKKGKLAKLRRGDDETLWVPAADFRCRCPRLRPRHTYLVVGNDAASVGGGGVGGVGGRAGIVVDRSSSVHKWRDQLARRLRHRINRC